MITCPAIEYRAVRIPLMDKKSRQEFEKFDNELTEILEKDRKENVNSLPEEEYEYTVDANLEKQLLMEELVMRGQVYDMAFSGITSFTKVFCYTLISSVVFSIACFDLLSWAITGRATLNVMFDLSVGLASAGVLISNLLGLRLLEKESK